LTSHSGITYNQALHGFLEGEIDSIRIRFIGKDALIQNKMHTGRTKDRADVEQLLALSAKNADSED
jgi:hypothetical protein